MTAQQQNFTVDTGHERYNVTFVHGAAAVASAIDEVAPAGRFMLITDSNVAGHYLDALRSELKERGRMVRDFVVEAGEASKSISTAQRLWDGIFAGDVDRGDTVVALGGGVVGDLAGFIAATTMRGLSFIQVPTTMLAMSDAAIGGKTGINVSAGKNLVGAFHQPLRVVAWSDSLATLDPRELSSGLAEVVKSALIDGDAAVENYRTHVGAAREGDIAALEACAAIGAGLKARIVSEDVKEHGVRAYLNLGHTFAHAIEHASGYGEWTHGEAVAAGMVIAARLSVHLGKADASVTQLVTELVEAAGLPSEPPPMGIDEWLNPIFRDKKRKGDEVKLILLSGPGGVFGRLTGFEELRNWMLQELCADAS